MGWKARDAGSVETLEEWRPFLRAVREVRREGAPWMLDPLDFHLTGWIERKGGRSCRSTSTSPSAATSSWIRRAGRTG